MTLRGRLFAALFGVVALTLVLTIALGALLTRRQVDHNQAASLARRADDLATRERQRPSYVVESYDLGAARVLVRRREGFAGIVRADVPSDGRLTLEGRRYLYSYRPLPQRGLLLLRPVEGGFGDWGPFLRDLVVGGIVAAIAAVALSFWLARSIARPVRRVAEASRALAAGEYHKPLPVEGPFELAALARAFNDMEAQLAASRDAERNFLLSVSHELKTPLTAIRGYAEGLAEGMFPPEEAAATITLEAQRLERLVRDILDLARMNRREFSVRREPVDLAEVARQAVRRHEAAARDFGVSLAAEGGETWIEADADRVLQVASNLVENALRETPSGGAVTVRVEPGRLVVADTGPGLAPEDVLRAFERFYLYDKASRERPVGTGLGLAIVEQLARAMGGSVSVESEPGGGARFVVVLTPLPVQTTVTTTR
ncbi:MAG TPA: HAMP domain-containing sensor histidine kinase [Gaiellaceae bacterium]